MNSVTIQINSLEALERLIGNDAELEINIRNAIVQKFTKKHLKAIRARKNLFFMMGRRMPTVISMWAMHTIKS